MEEIDNALIELRERLVRGSRDRWQDYRTVWMMLVGTRHLLRQSEPFLESRPISYDDAEQIAVRILESDGAVFDQANKGPNPWIAGFLLISAEHRLANSFDRTTGIFFRPKIADFRPRLKELLKACPNCGQKEYLEKSQPILAKCVNSDWQDLPPCDRVYKRVNEIKHPGRKHKQGQIENLSTATRHEDATKALFELYTMMTEMVMHLEQEHDAF